MNGGPRKILIVGDSELDLDCLEQILVDRFSLRRAGSGEEALAALQEFSAEVVLLDVVIPGIDGYETCRRITTDPRHAATKVILLSSIGATQERLRGYEVGASDYLVKPFAPAELLAKVDVFLALRAAQEESRAKSEFVADISHEIRTPMTAILGYSENLRDPALPEAARQEAIDTIWRNGQHLLELINNILDLSKIEANRMHLEWGACDPTEIIGEVVAMMRPRADGVGLQLTAECDGDVPVRIHSDRTRIKQVLINLVGNALKFTKEGSVRIKARLRADTAAGPAFEIDVIDTGPGIEGDQIERLCEPFVQADATVTRRFGGTGLGLSISRRLARMLGGDIAIRSRPGEGSTFTLRVAVGPLAGVATTRAAITGSTRAMSSGTPSESPRIPCRILLAEDGADNQKLLSFVLEKAGANVSVVADGRGAVDAALAAVGAGRPFDVILMDMHMPVLDGYAATSMLRQSGYTGAIVAVTAHAMAEDQQRCLASGCDHFIGKPINRDSLLRTIHGLLQGKT